MNISILYGVSGRHHLAVSKVDAHMTFPRCIIRSLEENKVTGLCFGFGNVLAFLPKTVGCGAPYIVAEAKPGDLVFFEGTYDTPGKSHVGIYLGIGMMVSAGDPIKYANIHSSYWEKHLAGFGRLSK